ncbi:MAG TPA: hypothetical protein VLF91_03690 [Candidatus Saccharimonadales bacterium]|nr:hypothetical protein [Candidatus Saccharimonadales bacterium]
MYFLSSEQHERTQAFDRLIADTRLGLQDPEVQLPPDSPDFEQMLENCFLPNIRGRRATIPRELRGDFGRIALLPMNTEEANTGLRIGALVCRLGPAQPIPSAHTDTVRGLPLLCKDEVAAAVAKVDEGTLRNGGVFGIKRRWAARDMGAIEADAGAVTVTSQKTSLRHGKYRVSVPVIQYRADDLAVQDPLQVASVLLHEQQHVADLWEWGPVFGTERGQTATELKAYAVMRGVLQSKYPNWYTAQAAHHVGQLEASCSKYEPQDLSLAVRRLIVQMKQNSYI